MRLLFCKQRIIVGNTSIAICLTTVTDFYRAEVLEPNGLFLSEIFDEVQLYNINNRIGTSLITLGRGSKGENNQGQG